MSKSPARREEAIWRMNSLCQTPLGADKSPNSKTAKPNANHVGVSILFFLTRPTTINTSVTTAQSASKKGASNKTAPDP
jgi:hypothetical protein